MAGVRYDTALTAPSTAQVGCDRRKKEGVGSRMEE